MTKDLAVLVTGQRKPPRETWLSTEEFLDAVDETLKKMMGC